ncbi:MAG: SCO family protein [Gammaproteobacteria bacterium]|nr:SCO family protein [Gammaproteobacteria bacterium]
MKYSKQILIYTLITVVVIVAGLFITKGASFSIKSDEPVNAMIYPKLKKVQSFEFGSGDLKVSEKIFLDHWTFVFFGYTYCPDICPTTMSSLREFYSKLPDDVRKETQVMLVSVDPDRDDPEQLKQYVNAFHPEFIGTTASHDKLEKFTRDFGALYYKVGDDENYLVDHTGKIFLINPKGERFAIFNKAMNNPSEGYDYDIEQMVKDFLIIKS